MDICEFELEISYCQFAFFGSGVRLPFNDWTPKHIVQGFSWQEHSACFKTIEDNSIHSFRVWLSKKVPNPNANCARALLVPSPAISQLLVEVASIGDGYEFTIPSKPKGMLVEIFPNEKANRPHIEICLVEEMTRRFEVLKSDQELSPEHPLLFPT